MTSESNKNPNTQGQEPHATVGDLLFATIVILMAAGVIYSFGRMGTRKPQKAKAVQTTKLDSLVQDSLSKTVEYQNALRANQEMEAKRADIKRYFNSATITR